MFPKHGLIFEWDQKKSEKNFIERGFDFEYACRSSTATLLSGTIPAATTATSDRRVIAIGEVEEEIYVIVSPPREQVRRIISARPASRRERDAYHKAFTHRDS